MCTFCCCICRFPNSIFAREVVSQLDPLTVTFSFKCFSLSCFISVCPSVALLKATYADNVHIAKFCLVQRMSLTSRQHSVLLGTSFVLPEKAFILTSCVCCFVCLNASSHLCFRCLYQVQLEQTGTNIRLSLNSIQFLQNKKYISSDLKYLLIFVVKFAFIFLKCE